MRAIVMDTFGPPEVLRVREVDKPEPGDKEILVQVITCSVNFGDITARNFRDISMKQFSMPGLFWVFARMYFGLRKPRVKILGSEFSGVVEQVGKGVKKFKPGDAVFGFTGQAMGAYAEYICLAENSVVEHKPTAFSWDAAAALPYGAIMALPLLKKAGVVKGHKILVNGASGGIGSAAVQLAKYMGAEVTAVCRKGSFDYVKALGADFVLDYLEDDFTQNGRQYNLIFDINGRLDYRNVKTSLTHDGCLLYVSFSTGRILQMLYNNLSKGRRIICTLAPGSPGDLKRVKELAEEGALKPVVDKTFTMEHAADAHRYFMGGSRKGSIVIRIKNIDEHQPFTVAETAVL